MTTDLIKVDRIRSADEAVTLEKAGAGLIGVDLTPDPRFGDGREITVETAEEISRRLSSASLVPVLDLNDDPAHVLRIVRAVHAPLVQSARRAIPGADLRARLKGAGIGIVYGGIEIAHDDDPGWILSDFTDTDDLEVAYFQADVLPEYRDSWAFLRDRSPEYENEFQITDLNGLAAAHPLLIGLNFAPDNVHEIAAALPRVSGLRFTLADSARRGGVRSHSYAETLSTLQALSR
ncbi:hypothetical protein Aab01nite_67230 [Paractinoplanes abujensis]|uniref:Phosphoribosylanthranilate isomerase n=1 Tax=Paractinoplanes abujensis TaxID=882441 RepID=A0A7W7CVP9_9ACTN|nr:hypothetical protein [Actinoplanes abujensis]MBB4695549.1 hypothetical protein [Actinoplanes abujensis]GID23133.1 hypothetical protein Aab01nite_67230 [Actinoplanes abujensis]